MSATVGVLGSEPEKIVCSMSSALGHHSGRRTNGFLLPLGDLEDFGAAKSGGRMRLFYVSANRLFIVAALLLFACYSLSAQTNNGGITGTILDSSGGAVVGAEVVATGAETHSVYTTTSTSTGAYRFISLVLGTYDITVTAKGFKTANVTGVVVEIN